MSERVRGAIGITCVCGRATNGTRPGVGGVSSPLQLNQLLAFHPASPTPRQCVHASSMPADGCNGVREKGEGRPPAGGPTGGLLPRGSGGVGENTQHTTPAHHAVTLPTACPHLTCGAVLGVQPGPHVPRGGQRAASKSERDPPPNSSTRTRQTATPSREDPSVTWWWCPTQQGEGHGDARGRRLRARSRGGHGQ